MKKYIPIEKRSKKAQREWNQQQRGTWTISPVTRTPKNSKAYDRKKARSINREDCSFGPFMISIYS